MYLTSIKAREILDSRGHPTIEVDVCLENGIIGRASVPSGASTGSNEAIELRDGDYSRYFGKGVRKAINNVETIITNALLGKDFLDYKEIDSVLIKLDGTENKRNLGANATLAVSLASCYALAKSYNKFLFEYINNDILGNYKFPIPMLNIINGGSHADNQIDVQEFMILPVSAKSISEAVRIGSEVFNALKSILKSAGQSTNVGDEGGFAPNLRGVDEPIEYILKAIELSGYQAGKDVVLALDAAASIFYKNKLYHLKSEKKFLNSDSMIDYYKNIINQYPIISIEDAMSEHDYEGWKNITKELGDKIQLVGDDLFVTNKNIFQRGIDDRIANAILIKPNQIGTITETFQTIELAINNDYKIIISHRSGETEDCSISHLAFASRAPYIKTGSICRSDRVAKYNELIRIEEYIQNISHTCFKSIY